MSLIVDESHETDRVIRVKQSPRLFVDLTSLVSTHLNIGRFSVVSSAHDWTWEESRNIVMALWRISYIHKQEKYVNFE